MIHKHTTKEPFDYMFGYYKDTTNPAHSYKGFPKHALIEILAHITNRCRDRRFAGVHYGSTIDFKDGRTFHISNSLKQDAINHADILSMHPLYIKFEASLMNSITLQLVAFKHSNNLKLYYFKEVNQNE